LSVDPSALAPLVTTIVEQVLARLEGAKNALGDKLAFSESEAARLMGLNVHQLRDERLRGRINASRIVGMKVRYLREDLVAYLTRNRSKVAG
jgi:hypothetical protein